MGEWTIPRIVVSATGSGVGKTTAAAALIGALRARGLRVAAFKIGPDYLDPTYLSRAAGAPAHNLDGWMMGREASCATLARVAAGADIAVLEGMMGLFDGVFPQDEEGSSAEMAKWLSAPVLLVVDTSGMARTIAAVGHGFSGFDPQVRLAGLLCNGVGGRAHLNLLRAAAEDPPVLGGLPPQPHLAFSERHLGLEAARESRVPEACFSGWADVASEWFDLDAILEAARAAPPLSADIKAEASTAEEKICRIGVATDEAFHFYYEDNLARLETLGAELVPFSPIRDPELPKVDGLYIGGGYPEVHAEALSQNAAMRESVLRFAKAGGVIYAECGGLMYLTSAIRSVEGKGHPMVGVFESEAVMSGRIQGLGYVEVETRGDSILGDSGAYFRGHQFRYSTLEPAPAEAETVYHLWPTGLAEGFPEGYQKGNTLASYVHAHWSSNPALAEGFVQRCAAAARKDG